MCFWIGTCLYVGDLLCTTLSWNSQLTQLPLQPQCKILNDQAYISLWVSLVAVVKNPSTCQCRRQRFDPSVGKTPGGGNGNPVQYSCLGNPMDREAWWATVHVGYSSCKSWRRLNGQTTSHYYLCPKNLTAYNLFLAYILKNKYIQIMLGEVSVVHYFRGYVRHKQRGGIY